MGDLTLVAGTPETDPLPDHANVIYVGPILWQKTESKLPDWIGDLRKDTPPDLGAFGQSALFVGQWFV